MRTLPPLPQRLDTPALNRVPYPVYTAKQMQDYALAEREECARMAEACAYMSDNFNVLAGEIRARD